MNQVYGTHARSTPDDGVEDDVDEVVTERVEAVECEVPAECQHGDGPVRLQQWCAHMNVWMMA